MATLRIMVTQNKFASCNVASFDQKTERSTNKSSKCNFMTMLSSLVAKLENAL